MHGFLSKLKRAGTPVPDNDLWIAALALEHDLRLITRDNHFNQIPQLLRASVLLQTALTWQKRPMGCYPKNSVCVECNCCSIC